MKEIIQILEESEDQKTRRSERDGLLDVGESIVGPITVGGGTINAEWLIDLKIPVDTFREANVTWNGWTMSAFFREDKLEEDIGKRIKEAWGLKKKWIHLIVNGHSYGYVHKSWPLISSIKIGIRGPGGAEVVIQGPGGWQIELDVKSAENWLWHCGLVQAEIKGWTYQTKLQGGEKIILLRNPRIGRPRCIEGTDLPTDIEEYRQSKPLREEGDQTAYIIEPGKPKKSFSLGGAWDWACDWVSHNGIGSIDTRGGDPMALFHDRSWYKPPRPSTPVCFKSLETRIDDLRNFEDGVSKIRHVIAAGPHNVSLILRRDVTPKRILEVLHRRTGIQGGWNAKILDEGDVKKGTPRRVLLTPMTERIVPQGFSLAIEMGEFRIFFGTIERKITAPIDATPEEAMRKAASEAKLDDKWVIDRSFPATPKTPPVVITKRIEPVELRQALPATISIFVADHIEGGRFVNQHRIKCNGGESSDQQARLVSQAFGGPMWILECVEEKDGLVHLQCTRLEFATIKFSFKEKLEGNDETEGETCLGIF
jgi:hypothetical protein